jgi:hypothetical protein
LKGLPPRLFYFSASWAICRRDADYRKPNTWRNLTAWAVRKRPGACRSADVRCIKSCAISLATWRCSPRSAGPSSWVRLSKI